MNILVTGATGQVGSEVARAFRQLGHHVLAPGRKELDLMQPALAAERVASAAADWVINCAAYTQVDKAESEPDAAFTVNRDSAEQLACAVAGYGGRLLHVSTDFVFDGRKGSPYCETDSPRPLGVYGQSKYAGEQAVIKALPKAVILRTAWVYGVNGHNFVKTMLRVAREGKPLRVVDDQVGTPTWARNIARAIVTLVQGEAEGVYHYTDAGSVSWFGFADAILSEARAIGFDIKTHAVEPITTEEYPTPARRPAYSVLDTGKITARFDLPIPAWRESLKMMLKELYQCETY